MGKKSGRSVSLQQGFQERRGLNNVLRLDKINAQSRGDGVTEGEGKNLEGRFAVEAFSEDTIDMRENEVNGILGEVVE